MLAGQDHYHQGRLGSLPIFRDDPHVALIATVVSKCDGWLTSIAVAIPLHFFFKRLNKCLEACAQLGMFDIRSCAGK